MRLCSFFLIVAVLTAGALDLQAQSPLDSRMTDFIKVTTEDGLASNNVYDVCMDRNGCLWLATTVGLSRYDGSTVKNYFKEEMTVRSNYVNYVFYDSRDRVWIGTDNGVAIYDINTGRFSNLEALTGVSIESPTAWFFETADGTMWISFKSNGLMAVDPDSFQVRQYFYNNIPEDMGYISRMWFDPERDLYLVVSFGDGLYFADLENETLEPFHPADDPEALPFAGKTIKGVLKFDSDTFYLTSTDRTLYRLDPFARTYEQVPVALPDQARDLRRVYRVSETMLAMVSGGGLYLYDVQSGRLYSDQNFRNYTNSLRGKNLHCLLGTLDDGLILGFHGRGLAIQQDAGFDFRNVRSDRKDRTVSLSGSEVSDFAEYDDSTLWVTTRQKGLFAYQSATQSLRSIQDLPIPDHLEAVTRSGCWMWLLSPGGIYRITPETWEVASYQEGGAVNTALVAAPGGHLSLLADDTVLEYDPSVDTFVPAAALNGLSVSGIAPAADGSLLVLSLSRGLFRWDGEQLRKLPGTIPDGDVRSALLYEDARSRIWLSLPASGICVISPDGKTHQVTTRSGLYSDLVSNIIDDPSGHVYIATDRSLSMLPPSGKMVSITKSDGLLNFGFSRKAAFRTSAGEILLGSRDGFIRIPPPKAASEVHTPRLEIAGVRSFGRDVPVQGNRVTLGYDQNSFDIETVIIDPRHINAGRTLYCLEGYDDTWVPVERDGKMSFIRIPPGRYRLRTYDADEAALEVVVRPHPLRSPLAVLLYVLAVLLVMALVIMYIHINEKRKREAHIMQMKIDLHEDKMNFFTGVAHEIKTPLTLITTPLNHMKGNPSIDDDARYDLEVIDKNATYLTRLVKELLELSKIEDRKYRLECTPLDLTQLLRNIAANFSEAASRFWFTTEIQEGPLYVVADASATMKIGNNLLLNAVKYASSWISVSLETREGMAVATFANDGAVIPPAMREKIFENFTQYRQGAEDGNDGFGIGLSVARALAGLQGGTLAMSERADCNEFVLTVPLAEEAAWKETDPQPAAPADGRETILLVEDHAELLSYLEKTLSKRFNILLAEDGESAFRLIESRSNIDLVITDIRMPKMNGLELCAAIKKDDTYSHILVVVLSANLTPEVQIACMEEGADAIVEKPFSMDFLISCVDNLLGSRKKLIESLSADRETGTEVPEGISMRGVLLLNQLNDLILKNMTDPEFGVDQLADEMGISRSSLNRKIRDLLQTTTGNYIREKRLEKAEELLRTSSLQVNEICYKVGFQTPSYFIKCFRKKYGQSPNEYANSIHP